MKQIMILVCFFSITNLLGQFELQCDTNLVFNPYYKFEFEKWNGSGTKTLKSLKRVTLDLSSEDTIRELYGALYSVNESSFILEPHWGTTIIDSNAFNSYKYQVNYNQCVATIPVQTIQSFNYDTNYQLIPGTTGFISLFAALIVAPITAIDKNSPNHFNTSRYQTVLIPSLIGTGASFTCLFIMNIGKNRFKLKPKLINKVDTIEERMN